MLGGRIMSAPGYDVELGRAALADAINTMIEQLDAVGSRQTVAALRAIKAVALAAPALLDALQAIVGQPNPNSYGYDAAGVALDDAWRVQARAAIALAFGTAVASTHPAGCEKLAD